MLNLNPYKYDTVEYHEYEAQMAKRNLEMVAEAAARRISCAADIAAEENADGDMVTFGEEFYKAVIEACETVVTANEALKQEQRSLEKKKAEGGSENA